LAQNLQELAPLPFRNCNGRTLEVQRPRKLPLQSKDVKRLKEPIPSIGALGYWLVDIGIETKIWAELAEPMPMFR
jgi:hypothetical protein